MPSRKEPLQFYPTMNPKTASGLEGADQLHRGTASNHYQNLPVNAAPAVSAAPDALNFYPTMNRVATTANGPMLPGLIQPSSSANQPKKRLPYAVKCIPYAATDHDDGDAARPNRIARKEEQVPQEFGGTITWEYAHDPKGHLVQAKRNGLVVEEYAYDAKGASGAGKAQF